MQREFIGRDQSAVISGELLSLGAQRIFLVTGGPAYQSCKAKEVLEPMLRGYYVVEFNDFTPNPTFSEVMAGVQCFNAGNCDTILAVGGGSVIDIAKSVNAFQAHPDDERAIATGEKKLNNSLAPLIAVPTTAGTGSEATHFAVIYVDGSKYSIASPSLMPDVSIVDATFTDTLPPYITACTGFDALCQSIESYWAVGGNKESREYATKAIKLLVKYLPIAVISGALEAREKVIIAANLAGKAINISKTTAPHALSYTITHEFKIAHGHAVALTLGEFFILHSKVTAADINSPSNLPKFSKTMQVLFSLLGVDDGLEAKYKWYAFMDSCGLESDLTKLGISTEEDVSKIINGVNFERLSNHPIKLTSEMMKSIFWGRLSTSTK